MFWGHDRNLWANDWATFILAFDWAWIKGYNSDVIFKWMPIQSVPYN